MKNIKYILFASVVIFFTSCNDPEDVDLNPIEQEIAELPELTSGSADFSNYVALGNSLTAGFTDGALFQDSQLVSMPSIMAGKFELVGGGAFTQPLMSDNTGGLLLGGNQILPYRLIFNGAGPERVNEFLVRNGSNAPNVISDLLVNNPTGPFNNMGVPGAKSFHLLAPGYGNLANLNLGLANPYFVRMTGATPNSSVLEMAVGQGPSFFSLWIGNNDVLGYATTGGDGSDPLTPVDGAPGVGFEATYEALIATLTAQGAQGVVANIPDVTTIPHFTTVPHNPLDPSNPDFGPQIATLNGVFSQINQVFAFLEVPERSIEFSTTQASEVIIHDETLPDLSVQIAGVLSQSPTFPTFVQSFGLPAEAAPLVAGLLGTTYGQVREATAADLLVLPSSSIIGQPNTDAIAALVAQGLPLAVAGQFSVEGVSLPLEDKWVLLPSEQEEIATRTIAFNAIIASAASNAGLALVDANTLLTQLANGGITSGDFILTSSLVTGGAFSLDGVHPTARGYALIANEFMRAIDATYGSNFEASGNLVDIGEFPTNFSPALQ